MPRKEQTVGEESTKQQTVRSVDSDGGTGTVAAVKASPPWPLIVIGIVATVIIVALFIGGWSFIMSHAQTQTSQYGRLRAYSQNQNGNSSAGNGSYGGGGFRRNGFGGGSQGQTAAFRGVITAVNGDTLTVAGQGKSVTVTESDSTTISGDKTDVAVNDTIVVYGTTNSDGSISATQIVVRNGTGASSSDGSGSSAPGA